MVSTNAVGRYLESMPIHSTAEFQNSASSTLRVGYGKWIMDSYWQCMGIAQLRICTATSISWLTVAKCEFFFGSPSERRSKERRSSLPYIFSGRSKAVQVYVLVYIRRCIKAIEMCPLRLSMINLLRTSVKA